jgi:hypothetical protein
VLKHDISRRTGCRLRPVRIGTWNLAGRWTPEHLTFLIEHDCDVWLLTETSERTNVPGFASHMTTERMAAARRWAGVFSRVGLEPLPDPHPASAMAQVAGLTVCSSVLPWRSCGGGPPWTTGSHGDKTGRALEVLRSALQGPEYAGSQAGRRHLVETLTALDLAVPTADLPHPVEGLWSIDHIAVTSQTPVTAREHLPAAVGARRLSDHDAYVVTAF